jgi:hypothetical protein
MKRWYLLFIISYCVSLSHLLYPLPLHRVILATDANPTYIEFWPVVAQAWTNLTGLRPTLALIADSSIEVDESLGDVIRFDPIPGIPTALQAQTIRLLLPALFPNEGCIMSDIDMIPLTKEYFINSVACIPDDCFVVYRDGAYGGARFPMCYNAALGKTYAEIFDIRTIDDIRLRIKQWHALGLGWDTDELVLFSTLTKWKYYKKRCIKLGHCVMGRIDRLDWTYNPELVQQGSYIDAHCLRPYSHYKKEIDAVVANLKK